MVVGRGVDGSSFDDSTRDASWFGGEGRKETQSSSMRAGGARPELLSLYPDGELDTDALATAIALQERARSPTLQAILDALMLNKVYQDIAPRLGVVHLFGASNILSDAASRGYDDTLRSVADALGITPKRIALSENALCFLQIALDNIDAVIALIRASKTPEEARNGLMEKFELKKY